MKIMRTFFSVAVILILAGGAAAQSQRATSYKNLKYPPIHDIQVPQPERIVLSNGMVIYLVEDHELPTITVGVTLRAGSRWEPADKAGLASLTGAVMRTGGSVSRSGDQLDEELDRLGARVETGIQQDSGGAYVSVLKEDIDKGVSILADILQHPAFPQDKIDLAKIQARDSIARRNDNPHGIFFREFAKIIYGKDSPYNRQPEYSTIDSITREDLVEFHKRFFQPENIILGAWGDFKSAEMRARIEKAFGGWARGGQPKPEVPSIEAAARDRAGIYSVEKPDMQQSWVLMGMLGGRRDDPDFYALTVMDQILGGGFASRLFSNVRSNQGLAYAVLSDWSAGWDHPGMFYAGGSSKPETTVKIYRSVLAEIEAIAAKGVTADELARAKDGILKGLAFEFDDTGKIVNRLKSYEYYGYPKDYLQQYRVRIDKVTVADVNRVAKQYLKPEKFAVLFVGPGKYEAPLDSLGKVTPIDISIPAPKQAAVAAATPESIAAGKAALEAAHKALGGPVLMAVKDYTSKATMKMQTPQGAMDLQVEATFNAAGKVIQKIQTPGGEMAMAYDGQVAWMKMGGQVRDLPPSVKQQLDGSLLRDSILLMRRLGDPSLNVHSLGKTDFEGRQVDQVAVEDTARKVETRLLLDPSTHLLLGQRYMSAPAMGGAPEESEDVYSDYKTIEGVQMPMKTINRSKGQVRVELNIQEVKLNPGLPDSAYQKPQ